MIPCDVTACRRDYKKTVLRLQSKSVIDFERVHRLGSPLKCERLYNISLEFYPLSELVSCYMPSGVESAVITNELLSFCVDNLCKCCFSCYLRFVFSGNKVSLSVTCLLDCFHRTHTGRFL
ncbi:hypothetical protein AVEN_126501-1 [Araneus ventricosus]|uniref:Uncharacterized protein n=1 Tax=Araneus ventricosus TaxID=182803 RepID=A0A4Y2MYP3_ARAVE|nr:hypothetical protein AVEN_126501-1 [Araneus ventricosus]